MERKTSKTGASVKNVKNPVPPSQKTAIYAKNVDAEYSSKACSAFTVKPPCNKPTSKKQKRSAKPTVNSLFKELIRTDLSLTPYNHFKLPIFTMIIGMKKMRVLFDSGSSVSLITKKGRHLIPSDLIQSTHTKVWAANNQALNLSGEITLTLSLEKQIYHKFLITHNDISRKRG